MASAAVRDAFTRRLDAGSAAPVVVAFSGGSDSTALLLCARAWTQLTGRPLLALTVDHRLHHDSAAWTSAAGATAVRLGAMWRPLSWRRDKLCSGLPAAAREARHALLADATREAGACVLLLGHTADDVAESELIRRDTPHHGRLREWAPSPAWPQGRGVFLLRPVLTSRRRELRTWTEAQSVSWLDDPANEDPRFGRTNARRQLLASPADPAAARTADWAQATPEWGAVQVGEAWGGVIIKRGELIAALNAVGLLGRAILCASGGGLPASRKAIEHVLERVACGGAFTMVVAGARIEAAEDEVRLCREIGRRRLAPLSLASSASQVFDGRFEITGAETGWTAQYVSGSAAQLSKRDREALRVLPPEVRPSFPMLLRPTGGAHLPAPLGAGPARVRSLVGGRLAAALSQIVDEAGATGQNSAREDHGGGDKPVLS